MTIQLPEDLEHSIRAQVRSGLFASVDDAMAEAARLLLRELQQGAEEREKADAIAPNGLPKRRPFWERADDLRRSVPAEEWTRVPTDGAKQLDHYLYGGAQTARAMNRVFADAQYWVALLSDKDQSRPAAQAMSRTLAGAMVLTTEEVLTEVLAFFGGKGAHVRQMAATYVHSLLSDPDVTVVAQSHESFLNGLVLYQGRPDKEYSLTDCISMITMRRYDIDVVLTHDDHFTQEGFTILL